MTIPPPPIDDRPLAIVHGNCQAESLRLVLGGASLATVRLPPVHELVADDLPDLRRLLGAARVLVSQPIRTGYRGLPIGTADVAAGLGAGTRLVIVPVVRYAGLYPCQAIIRPPGEPAATPPLVPYHDLRILAEAAGESLGPLRSRAVRAIAARSRAELQRREQAHGAVVVSDLFAAPGFELMRTINHPGNPVWTTLAARVRRVLGLTEPVRDPGRPLLNGIHAPREPAVIEALGLDDAPDPDWHDDGGPVPFDELRDSHLRWYADRPETVAAGLRRHADALGVLRR